MSITLKYDHHCIGCTGVELAQVVGGWTCNLPARVRFPPTVLSHGSVVLTTIDSIIDRTKRIYGIPEISEKLLKKTCKV